jgi:hypothetical protein
MEESAVPEPKDWFSADRPIANLGDDKLGRSTFAKGLAAAIRGWKGHDSLVLRFTAHGASASLRSRT